MKTLAALLLIAATAESQDAEVARADYRTQRAAGAKETVYVSYATIAPEHRDELRAALRLAVASTTRQPVIEYSIPQAVAGSETLERLNLSLLGWVTDDWIAVTKSYPYYPHLQLKDNGSHLFVRPDWLLLQLTDLNESDAYYRFLLGKIPKTRDEFLAEFGVDRDSEAFLRWGQIESDSGVAINKTRWLESYPSPRGYAWGTRDVLEVTGEKDPLEHLEGDFDHDGEEWILGLPKISTATGVRGVLQVYFLSDGDGNLVNEAPVDLVEDATRFRGNAAIINPGSCYQCHKSGLNPVKVNALAQYVVSGAEYYSTDDKALARIDAFHLGDLKSDIDRSNRLYGPMVAAVTGVSAEEASDAFKASIDRYDAPLRIADVARELGVTEQAATDAIAVQLTAGKSVGARVASLTRGGTIAREAWEESYETVHRYVEIWTQAGQPDLSDAENPPRDEVEKSAGKPLQSKAA